MADRSHTALALLASAVSTLALAGCAPAATQTAAETPGLPTTSEASASPTPEQARTWPPKYAHHPLWGRPETPSVVAEVPWAASRSHDGYRLNQEIDLIGDWAAAFHDPKDPALVHVEVFATGEIWDISPATLDQDHYSIVSVSFSRNGQIAVVLSIFEEFYGAEEPNKRLYYIDPDDGVATEVPPPAGHEWTYSELLRERGNEFVWASSDAQSKEFCTVAIEGGEPEVLDCFPGEEIWALSSTPSGLVVQVTPWREPLGACRTLRHLPSSGGQAREIGPAGECLRTDGVVLDGWDIWGMMDPDWPTAYFDAALLADGPHGEQVAFGAYENGSLTACHGYVYWLTHNFELMRWKPGAEAAEEVFPREHEAIFNNDPECSGTTLSFAQDDLRPQRDNTGPGTFTTFTLRPESGA